MKNKLARMNLGIGATTTINGNGGF
jgi:hypothetical protein